MAERIKKRNLVAGGLIWECKPNYHTIDGEDCECYKLVNPLRDEVFTYLEEKPGRFTDEEDEPDYLYLAYQYWNVIKLSDPNHIFRKSIHYLVGQNFDKAYTPTDDMSMTIEDYERKDKDIESSYKEDEFVNNVF
jgi:hypothetical protein